MEALTDAAGLMLVFSTVTFLSAARPVTTTPPSCKVFSYQAARLSLSVFVPFVPVFFCCAKEGIMPNTMRIVRYNSLTLVRLVVEVSPVEVGMADDA